MKISALRFYWQFCSVLRGESGAARPDPSLSSAPGRAAGARQLLLPQICLQERSEPFCRGAVGGGERPHRSHLPLSRGSVTAKSRLLRRERAGVGFYSFFCKDVKKETKQKLIKRSFPNPLLVLEISPSQQKHSRKEVNIHYFPKNNQCGIKPVPWYSCQHGPMLCAAWREGSQPQRLCGLQSQGGWHKERGRMESTGMDWEAAGEDRQHHTRRGDHHRVTATETLDRGACGVAAIPLPSYSQALVPSPPLCGARGALRWQQNALGWDPPYVPRMLHIGLHTKERLCSSVAFSIAAGSHRCPG